MRWLTLAATFATLTAFAGASPSSQPSTRPAGVGPDTLDGHLVAETRLSAVPLEQAIQIISDRCRVRIQVDWTALKAIGIGRDAPVIARLHNVKVSRALELICKSVEGDDDDHRVYLLPGDDGRSIVLTNMAGLKATAVDRDYPVGDLIHAVDRNPSAPPGPADPFLASGSVDRAHVPDPKDELVEYIEQTVDPDSWKDAGGEIGEVKVGGDHPTLHVHQTPSNQHKVEASLARFRENRLATEVANGQFPEIQRAKTEPATLP